MQSVDYSTIWQDSVPHIAWGTVALFALIVLGYSVTVPAALSGQLSYGWAAFICSMLCYACFTVMHDAGHGGIVRLGSKFKFAETVMGWAASVPLLLGSFPFFQKMHDRHHAFTNCPDRDPDNILFEHSIQGVLVSIYFVPIQYYIKCFTVYKNDKAVRATDKSNFLYLLMVHGSLIALMINGYALEVLCFAIIPMLVTLFLLVLFFDYLPHHPHKSLAAYQNTRVYPSKVLNLLLFGQNYHLAHHLYPRVPWYKYREVYHNIKPWLQAQNAPLENLGKGEFLSSENTTRLPVNAPMHQLLKVVSIKQLTPDSVTVGFALPKGCSLSFLPGQYVILNKWLNGALQSRCYSIVSAQGEQFTIAVKQTSDGLFSRFINQQLKNGDELVVQGPFGDFIYPAKGEDRQNSLVLIAGGSGITPILAILNSALQSPQLTDITLIYCCKSPKETMFLDYLLQQKSQYSNRLSIEFVFSQTSTFGHHGRLDAKQLQALLPMDFNVADFYLCGPATLNQMVAQTLENIKVAPEQIHIEQFQTQPTEGKGARHNVEVELAGGENHLLEVAENQTILAAANYQGIQLPHACGNGSCGSCKLKIIAGDTKAMPNGIAGLSKGEIQAGYMLTCQSKPLSDIKLCEPN